MRRQLRSVVVIGAALLSGTIYVNAQALTIDDVAMLDVKNAQETFGVTFTVYAAPPENPLIGRPRSMLNVANRKVKTSDGLFVIGLGLQAWKDKGNVVFNVQMFVSPREMTTIDFADIRDLPRRVLFTKALAPNDRYQIKEFEPYGLGELVAAPARSRR